MIWEPAGRRIDPGLVEDFQARRGIAFPPAYVALAVGHDGGSLDDLVVPFPDPGRAGGWNSTDLALMSFVDGRGDGTMDRLHDLFARDWPGYVPFARDTGGWAFAFDARAAGPMPVVLFRCGWDVVAHPPSAPVRLSDDFDGFLSTLAPEGELPVAGSCAAGR